MTFPLPWKQRLLPCPPHCLPHAVGYCSRTWLQTCKLPHLLNHWWCLCCWLQALSWSWSWSNTGLIGLWGAAQLQAGNSGKDWHCSLETETSRAGQRAGDLGGVSDTVLRQNSFFSRKRGKTSVFSLKAFSYRPTPLTESDRLYLKTIEIIWKQFYRLLITSIKYLHSSI